MLRYLFLTLSGLLFHAALAQNPITLGDMSKRLVAFFKTHHVQPPEIDSVFGRKVFDNLILASDPDKCILTETEYTTLKEKSASLSEEIKEGTTVFYDYFQSIYISAVERSEKIMQAYFESDINLAKPLTASVAENRFPKSEEHADKWKQVLRSSLMDYVTDQLESTDYELPEAKDLDTLVRFSKNLLKKRYGDYFHNLISIESELEIDYLNSITEAYDVHSNYFTMEVKQWFTEELQSERELFGITYIKNNSGEFEISSLMPGSSAWLSGEIHTGDVIISLEFGDGPRIELQGMTRYEASQLFQKTDSKELKIELRNKQHEIIEVLLYKGKVYSDDDIIKTAVLEGEKKIAYISLPDFYTNWTDTSSLGCANDVAKALIKLKRENIEGLILDLRDNGGGSLKEAVDLVGIFIDFGPVMIRKDYDGELWTMKDFNRGAIYHAPLIVLINEGSASASEVVAGSLQDHNRALIVGRRSFGKATGQSILSLDPMIELNLTQKENPEWGYVKITGLGIYRIDLSTNQLNGVMPDVELILPYDDEFQREADYPNVIQLDSINKKMYYTPAPEFDTENLVSRSLERQQSNAILKELNLTYHSLDSLFDLGEPSHLSLKDYLLLIKKEQLLFDKLDTAYSKKVTNYAAQSLTYDQEIYDMSEYMAAYRNDFLENVNTDYELAEAYSIMLDLLKK